MTVTEIQGPIRGPRALFAALNRDWAPPVVLVLGLAADRGVVSTSWLAPDSAELPSQPEAAAGIVITYFATGSVTREAGCEFLRELVADSEDNVLDLLLVIEGRWWSAFCADSNCCPDEGRAVPAAISRPNLSADARVELTLRWRRAIAEGMADDAAELASSLLDIRLRDQVLTELRAEPNRRAWHILRASTYDQAMLEVLTDEVAAALLSITSAAHYLDGELALANAVATTANERLPTYSLARLLRQGIDTKAPPSLLMDALTSAAETGREEAE